MGPCRYLEVGEFLDGDARDDRDETLCVALCFVANGQWTKQSNLWTLGDSWSCNLEANRIAGERSLEDAVMFLAAQGTQGCKMAFKGLVLLVEIFELCVSTLSRGWRRSEDCLIKLTNKLPKSHDV